MNKKISLEKHKVPALINSYRIQEYAAEAFEYLYSRSAAKKAIKKGLIHINGKVASTADFIEEGMMLELFKEFEESKKIFKLDFHVSFEDDYLAVIQKPAGYPTNGNYFKTIENALPHNLVKSQQKDALPWPQPVHRLDNPTSGLLLIAKTKKAQQVLSVAFERKQIFKTYQAIVTGQYYKGLCSFDAIESKSARTEILRKQILQKNEQIYSLLQLNPITGRTHQLRIHLSRQNFPILGDKTYGCQQDNHKNGLMLCSFGLRFTHPITNSKLNIEGVLPKRFRQFINRCNVPN
ncbi:RluA family pseudouridine synthase [Mesonia sp. HuA40]|uniref:RluA family pseudouridine synthase n=1 Tax=Mesonia sp. HuA40 TaxID=2602761 RepID=UPI0011C85966|nr:RluA family pseudouridine synthase [Mesonia sp. HuA40]TXK71525.1 RluA family pseudouridine synthase [Mesonia sp. HuA40]